jgi:hypothetical protein
MKEYVFTLRVWTDGLLDFHAVYHDAMSAIHEYDKFKDYGAAKSTREILLIEPNGVSHAKQFDAPTAS